MPQNIKNSQSNETVIKVIKDLKGVRRIADNLIVVGKGKKKHDKCSTPFCIRLTE
jgi:hypothetical protein